MTTTPRHVTFAACIAIGALLVAAPGSAAVITNPVASPTTGFDPGFTLIDFDELATGIVLPPNQYAALGVTSISQTDGVNGPLETFASSQSLPNYIATGPNNSWDGTALIQLSGTTDRIGLGIAAGDADVLRIYDSSFNLLESVSLPTDCLNCWFGFDRPTADIAFLELVIDFGAFDNLVFNPLTPASVPEPSLLLLIGSGLATAVVRSKRAKKLPTIQ